MLPLATLRPDDRPCASVHQVMPDQRSCPRRASTIRVFATRMEARSIDREAAYRQVVADRKACRLCTSLGLTNPSTLEFDSDEIGPWTLWQGRLDAEVLVVGQDWGDVGFFLNHAGNEVGVPFPTNKALRQLLDSAGIEIPPPRVDPRAGAVFFTNAVLCLKKSGLQAKVQPAWFQNCAGFLQRQIAIVSPIVVVALGYQAYRAVCRAFGLPALSTLRDAVALGVSAKLPNGAKLIAVYHCGNRGMRARPFEQQKSDWQRVRRALGSEDPG